MPSWPRAGLADPAYQSYLIPKLGLLWRELLSSQVVGPLSHQTALLHSSIHNTTNSTEEIRQPRDQGEFPDVASFTGTSLRRDVGDHCPRFAHLL